MIAQAAQGFVDFGNGSLVRNGREGIGSTRRLGGIGAGLTMGKIPGFCLIIMGRQIVVADGPGAGGTIVVLAYGKILLPPAQHRRSVKFGVAPHMVAGYRRKKPPLAIAPLLAGMVAMLPKHRIRVPIAPFPRQKIAALQNQNTQTGVGQGTGQGPAPGTAADDQDVGVHASLRGESQDR